MTQEQKHQLRTAMMTGISDYKFEAEQATNNITDDCLMMMINVLNKIP
jgi:hypothetical protein